MLTYQLRQAKSNYYDKESNKCEGNVKNTWTIINKRIKDRSKNRNITIQEENNFIDSSELPNKFNNYFFNIDNELISDISPGDTNFDAF